MYNVPKNISAPKTPSVNFWPSQSVQLNGGLNLCDKEWKLPENQSNKITNMWFANGELGKRWGQAYVNADENPATLCRAAYKYLFGGNIIKHTGSKLYKQCPINGGIVEMATVNFAKGSFFKYNGKLYYKQAGKYVCFDDGYNVIGTDGDCDITAKFTPYQSALALDATNKVSSANGIKITITASMGSMNQNALVATYGISKTKYYMISVKVKNGNAGVGIELFSKNMGVGSGGAGKYTSGYVTDTSDFTELCIKIQPSDWGTYTERHVEVGVYGEVDQYAYVDELMIREISAEDYILSTSQLKSKYPYTNLTGEVTDVVPYIPTVIINRTPTGGGDTNEDYNRLGAGFKNSFNGTGAATVYTLTDTNLDATTVTCTVGGVAKTEGVDFTVDRTAGTVTFGSAPASGTNNVIITAYKTTQTDIDSFLDCMYTMPFGGQNDNRVFFAGNGTGYYYWTGISSVGVDPTYVPLNNYNIIADPDENITGFAKQYDSLLIFKAREIYGVNYSWNGTTGVFNSFPINAVIGCDMPETLQVVNNQAVWFNTYLGGFTLVGTAVQSEKNVKPISRNINPRLLKETNLAIATSVDFNGKYWLCVNDKVYLWDYTISPYSDLENDDESAKRLSWWYFDTIDAGAFIMDGQDLYYVDRTSAMLIKFITTFYDFGAAISATYRYPYREMGGGAYEFSVIKGFADIRGDKPTSIIATYFSSDDVGGDPNTESVDVNSFNWAAFSWDNFTWDQMGTVFQWALYPYQKHIKYFACEFTNAVAGTDMNISNLQWTYIINKMIK